MANSRFVSVYSTPAPPFPTAIMASAYELDMKSSLGITDHYSHIHGVITNKHTNWRFAEDDIKRLSTKIVTVLAANPKLLEHCRTMYLKHIRFVIKALDHHTIRTTLSQMSSEEIVTLLKSVAKHYQMASYYVEPIGFSLEIGGQSVVRAKLHKELSALNISLPESEFNEYFSSLINFTDISFVQSAEKSLLHIALLPKSDHQAAIRDYEQRYYWQYFDYYGPLLNQSMIKQELEVLLHLSRNELKQRITEIDHGVQRNEQKRQTNLRRFPISESIKTTLYVLQRFAYFYSDQKKILTTQANVGLGMVVSYLTEKYKFDQLELHFATVDELIDLIKGQALDAKTLRGRMKMSTITDFEGEHYYHVALGHNLYSVDQEVQHGRNVSHIKGMSANPGKYTGTARVVMSISQMGRVKKGDVLITSMTTVNFVPVMKIAGAIVTDLGGITSHAAIVARELQIPCIVGTKLATWVFKDGDTIEVDAQTGIVRKV